MDFYLAQVRLLCANRFSDHYTTWLWIPTLLSLVLYPVVRFLSWNSHVVVTLALNTNTNAAITLAVVLFLLGRRFLSCNSHFGGTSAAPAAARCPANMTSAAAAASTACDNSMAYYYIPAGPLLAVRVSIFRQGPSLLSVRVSVRVSVTVFSCLRSHQLPPLAATVLTLGSPRLWLSLTLTLTAYAQVRRAAVLVRLWGELLVGPCGDVTDNVTI